MYCGTFILTVVPCIGVSPVNSAQQAAFRSGGSGTSSSSNRPREEHQPAAGCWVHSVHQKYHTDTNDTASCKHCGIHPKQSMGFTAAASSLPHLPSTTSSLSSDGGLYEYLTLPADLAPPPDCILAATAAAAVFGGLQLQTWTVKQCGAIIDTCCKLQIIVVEHRLPWHQGLVRYCNCRRLGARLADATSFSTCLLLSS